MLRLGTWDEVMGEGRRKVDVVIGRKFGLKAACACVFFSGGDYCALGSGNILYLDFWNVLLGGEDIDCRKLKLAKGLCWRGIEAEN